MRFSELGRGDVHVRAGVVPPVLHLRRPSDVLAAPRPRPCEHLRSGQQLPRSDMAVESGVGASELDACDPDGASSQTAHATAPVYTAHNPSPRSRAFPDRPSTLAVPVPPVCSCSEIRVPATPPSRPRPAAHSPETVRFARVAAAGPRAAPVADSAVPTQSQTQVSPDPQPASPPPPDLYA